MAKIDRRKLLVRGMQLPFVLVLARAADAACMDPEELSDTVQAMRDSLEYTDAASDPKQACGGCSYFKAEKTGASCGNCELLRGPVSAKGHCVSWTKRQ